MNDLEVLKAMLTRAGIVFIEARRDTGTTLWIDGKAGPNNLGEMWSEYIFDDQGSLKTVRVDE